MSTGGIEKYDAAKLLVDDRLKTYDLDLENVRIAGMIPRFAKPYIFLLGALLVYLFLTKKLLPVIRKWNYIKNPPEGYWVCPKCQEFIPELSNYCNKCKYARKKPIGK
ncbi:MAG: hypothetical protein HQL29_05000 [Candidatus Omnitrophica bacterium]|nr:hypothetical protein [Candidatus Omnitrophota bacterium]